MVPAMAGCYQWIECVSCYLSRITVRSGLDLHGDFCPCWRQIFIDLLNYHREINFHLFKQSDNAYLIISPLSINHLPGAWTCLCHGVWNPTDASRVWIHCTTLLNRDLIPLQQNTGCIGILCCCPRWSAYRCDSFGLPPTSPQRLEKMRG